MSSNTSLRTLAGPTLLTLLGAAAAFACATQSEVQPEEEPPPPDASHPVDAGVASDADAEASSFDAGPCSDSGLCTVSAPIDTRVNVSSIWGSSEGDVWAVGSNRTVLHYDGSKWEQANPIEPDAWATFTMRAVWLGGSDDVWIADGQMLRHSTGWKGPSATEWTTTKFESMLTIPTSISGKNGTVFIGRQLDHASSVNQAAELVRCRGWSGPGDGGDDAGGGGGLVDPALFRSGLFNETGTNGIWSIAMTREDEAWAVGVGTKDRPGARVVRIYLAPPDGGAADAGATWKAEEHDSRTARNLYGVWGNDAVVWIVGEGGAIRRTSPERVSSRVFETVPSPVTGDLRGVFGFADDDVWAVGDDATVVHWNGEAWTKIATPFDASNARPRLFTVWGSSPSDVWIGGNGVLMHFEGKAP